MVVLWVRMLIDRFLRFVSLTWAMFHPDIMLTRVKAESSPVPYDFGDVFQNKVFQEWEIEEREVEWHKV